MKRFFCLLLFAAATTIAAHAQSVNITSPSGTATSPVTITGTTSGFGSSVTGNLTVVVTSPTGTSTTLSAGPAVPANTTWSITWTPTVAGNYTLLASYQGISSSAVAVTISGVPTISSLSLLGGGASMPAGASRIVNVTAIAAGAIDHVEFYLDAVLFGTVTAASSTTTAGTTFTMPFTAPTVVGSHQINAKVYDSAGNTGSSNFLSILVTAPIGAAPSVGLLTPASGAFLPTGTQTTLTGTVADTDGTISGVQVFANGLLIGSATVTGGAWSIAWTPSALGAIQLTAIATDDKGNASVSPAAVVNVTEATSPTVLLGVTPGTNAATSTTLPTGATRNVLVSATSPVAGRAVVRVEFFVDGTKVGEKTTAPYSYRFVAGATPGTSVFSARATDSAGVARDAQYTFSVVSAVGQPPTVNLLSPTSGITVVPTPGTAITTTSVNLAASAIATGGSIASVQFYANGSPTLNTTSTNPVVNAPYIASFNPNTPGTYVLDAIVTDDRGNTKVSNAVTITAAFGTPSVSITSPNPNATARATPNIPLTITATATGGSGASVLLVEFLLDGVQIGTRTAPTTTGGSVYSFSWTPTPAQIGTHQLTARVTDTNSLTATSTPAVNVSVATVVGTPPAITISTQPAQAGTTFIQTLSTVNFLANAFANGTGSTLSSVEFFINDASIGLAAREQTTNLYRLSFDFSRFDFSSVTPDANTGRYALAVYAIAKDSNNNQTVSATTTLTINPSTSAPPTVQLQALGGTAVAQNTQFPLLATPNDPDGTVSSIQLFANGVLVPNATFTSFGAQTLVTYPSPTAGRFNLYTVVTDDTGNTAVSSPAVVLNVTALGTPSTVVTRPTDDSTVTTAGAPVFLEATASSPDTTGGLTVQFVPTASNGSRGNAITATRVGTTTTYRAVFTTNTADTYTITSTANFSGVTGNSANSRKVVVSNVVGLAPTVSVTAPTSGSSVSSASTTNFVATASDPDGSVVSVEFFLNRNSIGQATRDPQANTWRLATNFAGINPGTIEVVAIVRDSSGNIAASPTGTVTIAAATSAAPTITLLANPSTVAFGQPIALTANASDVDGAVSSVQYFVNGASVGTSTNPNNNFLVNFTSSTSGTFNVFAIATDNSGGTANTAVSQTLGVTVRRNNPIVENDAFIQQAYTDITNTTANAVQLANYDTQLAANSITRGQLVSTLATNNANFTNIVNALAAYYVLMGQWPTTANYTTIFNSRGNLATVCGIVISSQEFIFKNGLSNTLSVATLNNPLSVLPVENFLPMIYKNAGLGTPSNLQQVQFMNNTTSNLSLSLGRGYNVAGLNTALAEFITFNNSKNTALIDLATAAALYYQLDKPSVVTTQQAQTATTPVVTQDAAATRIAALAALPDTATAADATLKDTLYTYRYVTILTQPQSLTVAARSGALFRVDAIGQPPLRYQWLLNGSPVVGATGAFLSVTNVDATKTGTYTVAVSSAVATATSDPATLTVSNALTKLGNISTRGTTTGNGAQTLIAGFVVTTPAGSPANQTRQMLIRVIGPALANQGVPTGFLPDPRLEVYGNGSSAVPILTNDNWGTQTANAQTNATAVTAIQQATNRTGAFALPNVNSNDAVVLATLAPGNYTVVAKGQNANASGVVLIEVYDATPTSVATNPKAINVSTRGAVGTGLNSMIAGFVINGSVSRRVLIRGVGPTLASFGLGNAGLLADPQIELFDSANVSLLKNDNWASGDDAAVIAAAAVSGGAFPLASGSKDAAILTMLPPGAYTVLLTGVGNTTGLGLVEVYDVDP